MPAKNALEWFAGGNISRKKRLPKGEAVQVVVLAGKEPEPEPEPAAEPDPRPEAAPETEPRTVPEPDLISEMVPEDGMSEKSYCNSPATPCGCKKVQFQDKTPKSAMKKGTENAELMEHKGKPGEDVCMCDCRACNVRNEKGDSRKNGIGGGKPEQINGSEFVGKKSGKQKKQSGQQQDKQQYNKSSPKFHNSDNAINSNGPKQSDGKLNFSNIKQRDTREYPQSRIYSEFIRRNMSRLIQPPRSEVIIREDVIECPSDPKPNAFFDARIGILRVYHGPHYGNSFGSLVPLVDQGIALGSAMGSRMPMTLGGDALGNTHAGIGVNSPMMSGGLREWPGFAGMGDPANDPHWTAVSGPGALWPGTQWSSGRFRQSYGSGGGGMGGFDSKDGRGDEGQQDHGNNRGNGNSGWNKWTPEQHGNNREDKKSRNQSRNQNPDRGSNNNKSSSGAGTRGDGNGGRNTNVSNNNGNRSNSNPTGNWYDDSNNDGGNGDWNSKGKDGDDDQWNDNTNDNSNGNANDDSNSNQENADALANLPGSWNDYDGNNEKSNENSANNNYGWKQPSTPPGWAAENGNAGDDQTWGGDDSNVNENNGNGSNWNESNGNNDDNYDWNKNSNNQSRNDSNSSRQNNQNNNKRNNKQPRNSSHNQSWNSPNSNNKTNQTSNAAWNTATQTALSGGSWDNSGTGPTTTGRGNKNKSGGGNEGRDWNSKWSRGGNGNNKDDSNKTWGPPKVQASWANPDMAAKASDWNTAGGGGGGGGGGGVEDMWR